MQYKTAWQVKGRRQLCRPRLLLVSLPLHLFGAGEAELHPGIGVDGIVDTSVIGAEAPEQLAVGGVDNGIAAQGGDIPLPEIDPRPDRAQRSDVGNSLAPDLLAQVGVLYREELKDMK